MKRSDIKAGSASARSEVLDMATRSGIELSGFTFAIGDAVRVGPIDLSVPGGSTLGIVGESGAGKSLLCRSLVGLLGSVGGSVKAGHLVVEGTDMARAGRKEWGRIRRGTIGFVPQASLAGLNPVRTVGSQLRETLKAHGMAGASARERRALELLEQVRMPEPRQVLQDYAHQLSGGMRQRVMIALALAGTPRILVADEPTTALDPTVEKDILDLLGEIQRQRQMTVVIVSHDMRVIRRLCHRVAVMYAGRIVEEGPTLTVLNQPRHPYTRALVNADPALVPRGTPLSAIEGGPPHPGRWHQPGCSFAPRCAFATQLCQDETPVRARSDTDRVAMCHHSLRVVNA